MVTVAFSCDGCGLKNTKVKVLPCKKEEDVVWWVQHIVMASISLHHSFVSPNCTSKEVKNIVIPVGGVDQEDAWIGKDTDSVPPDRDWDKE